jgi:hypothetical protein
MTWQRLRDVFANRVVIGTTPDVGRLFVRCHDCSAVVPAWDLVKTKIGGRTGCRCGSVHVRPKELGFVTAAWWLFVRGFLIRRALWRRDDWDPRIPWRQRAA